MKRLIFILLLSFINLGLFAQTFQFPKKIGSASIKIEGTQLMIDQGEVAVSDWLSFIYNNYYNDELNKLNEGFEKMMPDTLLLPEKYRLIIRLFLRLQNMETSNVDALYSYTGDNSNISFFLPLFINEVKGETGINLFRFLQLPIVGITYEQAQAYLLWRTELANKDKRISKTGYKVKARMMKKEEWINFAINLGPHLLENQTTHIDSSNTEGCYFLNVKIDKPCASMLELINIYGEGAVPIYSYDPDRLELYCIFGNVSEMTEEKGIALGGSYKDYAIDCDALKTTSYSEAQPWLGFRCVLEFYQ